MCTYAIATFGPVPDRQLDEGVGYGRRLCPYRAENSW
ncbi:uncharacterized protein FTOL_06885 [Fusarium torulosum]|uniref:Uncharacterized protein n=1 Tax=Fusarium torulosum TaxID=33205 RepID=A0AAE8MCB6_9HYPO|nr:uncharacterized protein FTOL_06885 [Fusarium torulosum]